MSVPPEVASLNLLTPQQIAEDGDEGARDIFAIADHVVRLETTDIARAYVDLNRPEDDRGSDGVVKTETCWSVPIYSRQLDESLVEQLLSKYYRPYHRRLSLPESGVRLGIDCHTMAAVGPPIGPLAGQERPYMCLSNANGTCPPEWLGHMAVCLESLFDLPVSLNHPFKGGFIIRHHSSLLPWLQLELSRAPFLPMERKCSLLLQAFDRWCKKFA